MRKTRIVNNQPKRMLYKLGEVRSDNRFYACLRAGFSYLSVCMFFEDIVRFLKGYTQSKGRFRTIMTNSRFYSFS